MVQGSFGYEALRPHIERWERLAGKASGMGMKIPATFVRDIEYADIFLGLAAKKRKKRQQNYLERAIHRYGMACAGLERCIAFFCRRKAVMQRFYVIPLRDDLVSRQSGLRIRFQMLKDLIAEGEILPACEFLNWIEHDVRVLETEYQPRASREKSALA
jgi:hypothetical protein